MTHAEIAALLMAPSPDVVRLFRMDSVPDKSHWWGLPEPHHDIRPLRIGDTDPVRGDWRCATDVRDLDKWWPEYALWEALEHGAKPVLVEVPLEYCHDCGTQWCFDPKHAKLQVLQ